MPTSGASSGRERNRPRRRAIRALSALLVLAAAAYVAYHFAVKSTQSAGCRVHSDDDTLELTQSQAANAATIAAVATARGLPERAVTIALATALQESRLDNLDHGDRDSLGLFQQRPSQGWGTSQQILDPVYSTNEFYDGLVKIDGYSRLPLTVAAQKVQRSGYPQAYAKHEADATMLAAALVGRKAGALSCTTGEDKPDSAGGAPGDPALVTTRLKREFGAQARPKTAGQPASTVTVPAAPAGGGAAGDTARRGWQLAEWSVAHSQDLRIATVSFGGMQWRAARSGSGWQKVPEAAGGSPDSADSGFVRITVAQ
ncbi:heavy metal transporter [Streptomyces sp. NBC_01198]|uniref:heavy metal transporter n=1 Tax=Streptomyces sp. NBC_01198 TaxID=2903769 RepID=UPI002E0F8162|nr:heavy metal transporter [Streptomyces sp. NBC_01198]